MSPGLKKTLVPPPPFPLPRRGGGGSSRAAGGPCHKKDAGKRAKIVAFSTDLYCIIGIILCLLVFFGVMK